MTTQQSKTDEKTADIVPDVDDDVDVAAGRVDTAPEGDDYSDAPSGRQLKDPRAEAVRLYREKRAREEAEHRGEAEPQNLQETVEETPEPVLETPKPAPIGDDMEIELTVYGQPVRKKLSEIKAEAQKSLAADQKLEEAKRLVDEVRQLKQALAQRQGDDGSEHQPIGDRAATGRNSRHDADGDDQEHQPDVDLPESDVDSIVERIQVGDTDAGREAIKDLVKILKKSNTSSIDETKVRDIINADRTRGEINAAIEKFSSEFPAIASDDDLADVVLRRLASGMRQSLKNVGMSEDDLAKVKDPKELAALHERVRVRGAKNLPTYDAMLTEAGNYVVNKFGIKPKSDAQPSPTPAPKPAAPPVNRLQERQDMKRQAPQQPRAAGARAPVTSSAPRPKTNAEIVAEMRRARRFS